MGTKRTSAGGESAPLPSKEVAVWRHIGDLHDHPKNPKKATAASIAYLQKGMRRFGFPAPVVVWQGRDILLAGHGAVKALAGILRTEPTFALAGAPGPGFVPAVEHPLGSEEEALAYLLADNRSQELASWDAAGLRETLASIEAAGACVQDIGWAAMDLGSLEDGPRTEATPVGPLRPPDPRPRVGPTSTPADVTPKVRFGKHEMELTAEDAELLRGVIARYGDAVGSYEALGDELARRF